MTLTWKKKKIKQFIKISVHLFNLLLAFGTYRCHFFKCSLATMRTFFFKCKLRFLGYPMTPGAGTLENCHSSQQNCRSEPAGQRCKREAGHQEQNCPPLRTCSLFSLCCFQTYFLLFHLALHPLHHLPLLK